MSGGVDSSFAALKLLEAGVEVIGVHLHMGEFGAWREDARDAEKAAAWLDIPFHVVDVSDRFYNEIILPFACSYGKGLTPNPCVICNPCIKVRTMIELAEQHGADVITTGHHARVKYCPDQNRFSLQGGARRHKDQSYFLARLTPQQLERLVLPAGWYEKDLIREELEKAGFLNFDKPESQDICFVDQEGYQATVERILQSNTPPPGEIVDLAGRVMAYHPGIHHFTIGQRKGLGISKIEPHYVVDIDTQRHRLIVGPRSCTYTNRAMVDNLHWIAPPPGPHEKISIKERYRTKKTSGRLSYGDNGEAQIHFNRNRRAITPGQYAVFYRDREVLGCGTFTRQCSPEQLLISALPVKGSP